jgi:erythronate-4-phosphate dehydrogenase
VIHADATERSFEQLLWEVYSQTYDVTGDDRKLKRDPEAFERLRGEYPLRREPPAYAVRLFGGTRELGGIMEKLGFSVLEDHCV